MSAAEEVRGLLERGGRDPDEADELLARYDAERLGIRQAEHEADLERARDRSHRLGVQAVVDGIRGRLMQTAGVPSRTSLLAHLASLERTSGVERG